MKNRILLIFICLLALTAANAQKWTDLTDEQKLMKAKEFRADNQKYLKETLGMTKDQMEDIDNVNICYLSTLDRIDRYAKDDETKGKYAQAVTAARSAQLDVIMGTEKHKQYYDYIKAKLQKAAN